MSDWECHTAPGSTTPYYYNKTTGVTQWHAPLPLAVEKAAPATSCKRSNPTRILALESTDFCSAPTTGEGSYSYANDDDDDQEATSKEHGKDYKYMAKEYRIMQKYRDLKGK
jgi:WW domain